MNTPVVGLGLIIGTNQCNARCQFCGGLPLRSHAPTSDYLSNANQIRAALHECAARGAHYVSLTSSGEPTLSPQAVTQVLEILHTEFSFHKINLYTNGIRLGEDLAFCQEYLPVWKKLGLSHFYMTIHDVDEKKNAQRFQIQNYPPFHTIFDRLTTYGFQIRANIILQKGCIDSLATFKHMVETLTTHYQIPEIAAWPLRDPKTDKVAPEFLPDHEQLVLIRAYVDQYNGKVKLHWPENPHKYLDKPTLFQNNILSDSWCS